MDRILQHIKTYWLTFVAFVQTKVFTIERRDKVFEFVFDLKDSLIMVIKGIKPPDKKGWRDFLLYQLIATTAGWTAATLASDLVGSNFKFKSVQNLWGLKGKNDGRTLVNKEEYELYDWWARFLIGLIIMIVVRYLVMQTINEFEKIRANKRQKAE